MKKRVLSMLLAFILCFSTLPMTAFAQEADAVTEQEEQQEAAPAAEPEEQQVAVPAAEQKEAEAAAAPGEETPADKSTTAATPGTEDPTAGEAPDTVKSTGESISDNDAGTQDTSADDEKKAAVQKVQALIDALPETVTVENAESVGAQLEAIDEAMAELTEEQREELDMTRLYAISEAMNTPMTVPMTVAEGQHADHPICGAPCTDGDEHGTVTDWQPIGSEAALQAATEGHYYLTQDIETTGTWEPNNNVVLCLNGHSIAANGNFVVIEIKGANFTLCDCNSSASTHYFIESVENNLTRWVPCKKDTENCIPVTGGVITHSAGTSNSGVEVDNKATFTMYGGTICGHKQPDNYYGAGVYVYNSTFNMYGGAISGNAANRCGGVAVLGSTFNMYGGVISDNMASAGYGGVLLSDISVMNMSGNAQISDNIALAESHASGGGVYIFADYEGEGNCLIMSDNAKIIGNKAASGGAVYVGKNGQVTMRDNAQITNNTATKNGGGIYIYESAQVTMSDNAQITENTAAENGGGVYVENSTFKIAGGAPRVCDNLCQDVQNNVYLTSGQYIHISKKSTTFTGKIGVSTADTPAGSSLVSVAAVAVETGGGGHLTEEDLDHIYSDKENLYPVLVGGVVKLSATEPHRHPVCGATCGDSTHHGNQTWIGVSNLTDIKSGGYYYLTDNVKLNGTWTCNNNVALCLNGKTITCAAEGDAIQVAKEKTLIITDCQKVAGKITHAQYKTGRGIMSLGTLILYNGEITKNEITKGNGAGVYVDGGDFYMYNGSISNNKVSYSGNGGGVYAKDNTDFVISGGSIDSNYAMSSGGGIYYESALNKSVNFTISGGNIVRNSANGNGGGILLKSANGKMKFIMSGGMISSNVAGKNGGGVYIFENNYGKFTVSGAAQITGNAANLKDNNVYLPSAKTIFIGAKGLSSSAKIGVTMGQQLAEGVRVAIAKGTSDDYTLTADDLNAFSSDTGYDKYALENAVNFSNGELHVHRLCGTANCTESKDHKNVLWTAIRTEEDLRNITGGSSSSDRRYYYLKNNIALNDTSWNPTGDIALCLNGYSITANGNFDTITVNASTNSAASLTLCDCNGSGNNKGEITHANGMKGHGVYVTTSGWFYQYGGNITGNSTSANGGGVYLDGSFFYMYGGSITGNSANDGGGVAGCVSDNVDGRHVVGNLLMLGGTITGNKATANGGGVAMDCSFEMCGGSITNNEAGDNGGGVAVKGDHSVEWSGGSVTGNTAKNNGGGVYVDSNAKAMKVGGDVNITGNTENDVFLYEKDENSKSIIHIDPSLTNAASIGVATNNRPRPNAPVQIASGATGSVNYTEIFKPNTKNSSYLVTKDAQGNLYLSTHQHSWQYTLDADGKTITATCANTTNCPNTDGGSVTIKAPEENTLIYDGSNKTATLENQLLTGEQDPTISYTVGNGQGATLPDGSYPTNAGQYTASITVGGVTASVTYEIQKADPAADNFVFTVPGSLTYDGTAKTAGVKTATDITGMGDVMVKYYQGETEVQPMNAGDYKVKISVTDGMNFNAASNLADESWAFTINRITTSPTVELSGNTTYTYTGKQITPDVTVTIDGKTLTADTDYTIIYGDNVNAGTNAGSVTVKAKGNYGFADVVKNFTIEKADPKLSFEKPEVTTSYGTQPANNTLTNEGDGVVTYESSNNSVATVKENGEVTVVGVGETTITATAAKTTNYKEGTASYTLSVNKARVHIVQATVANKDYDGSVNADVTGVVFANEADVRIDGLVAGTDYMVTGAFHNENAGEQDAEVTVKLLGDFDSHYELTGGTYKTRATITAKPISIATARTQDRSYERNNTSVTILEVTFKDSTNTLVATLTSSDYTATGKMVNANVGTDKKVTVTVTLQGKAADNYKLVSNMTTAKVAITQAKGGVLQEENLKQKFSDRKQKTFTPDYTGLPAGETWTYSISEAQTSGSAKVEPAMINTAGKIAYRLTAGAENDTICWTVTISNPNYKNFTKDLVLTLTAKDPQETLRITGDNTVVYGQKLQLSTVGGSGTGEITYSVDAGSTGNVTIDENGVLTPVKVGSVVITATKAGDVDYSEITSEPFVIMITRAATSGEPKYNKITTGGMTLADAGLTLAGSTIHPADGILEWIDDAGVLPNDTAVEMNKTYKWRFTPADTNYEILTGEIELYHVDAPAVTAQPRSVSVTVGEKATFEVTATGTDVTYQWQIDRNDGNGFVDITGATGATYTTGVTDRDCNGFKYQCVLSNAAGSVTTDTVVLTVQYQIIEGANGSWNQNTDGGSLRIRGNGEYSKFQNVKVDGNIIDSKNYTVSEGSTIIELHADYLKTLSEGSHTFEIVWTDGSAGTGFTVARNTSGSNNTGSNNTGNNDNNDSTDNSAAAAPTAAATAQELDKVPATGDASGIWIALFVVSAVGLAAMLVRRKKQ